MDKVTIVIQAPSTKKEEKFVLGEFDVSVLRQKFQTKKLLEKGSEINMWKELRVQSFNINYDREHLKLLVNAAVKNDKHAIEEVAVQMKS